jgi:conjugal transfer pilus assembly protein TraB
MLGAILAGGVGLLWLIFAFTGNNGAKDRRRQARRRATECGHQHRRDAARRQVNPVDQWVGTAGSKLAQYENEREEQGRLNKDRQAFEAKHDAALRGPGTAADLGPAGGRHPGPRPRPPSRPRRPPCRRRRPCPPPRRRPRARPPARCQAAPRRRLPGRRRWRAAARDHAHHRRGPVDRTGTGAPVANTGVNADPARAALRKLTPGPSPPSCP